MQAVLKLALTMLAASLLAAHWPLLLVAMAALGGWLGAAALLRRLRRVRCEVKARRAVAAWERTAPAPSSNIVPFRRPAARRAAP